MDYLIHRNLPVFVQICDNIRKDIFSGALPADAQIPSVRQLAVELSANPNTVQKALAQLEAEGLLYTKRTIGRFVTSNRASIEAAEKKTKRLALERVLSDAYAMGITSQDILDYLREEGTENEHTDSIL